MVLVILFMTVLYRFYGFISGINLTLYMLLVMGIFWLIGGVLTLPGIAALVLGIGMAVDSCVITAERIKEELNNNASLSNAYVLGNKQSWSSIFDANVTTLIVAIVLYMFGESSVKGFATMLMITIFATMFIMVLINKFVLYRFVKTKYFENKTKAFVGYNKDSKKTTKKLNIDAIKILKKCFTVTIIYLVIGTIFLCTRGFNLGIDFRAGSDVTLKADNMKIEEIKKDMKSLGYKVISAEKQENDEVYVKLDNELKEKDINKVNKYFKDKYNATSEINVITNVVKQELVKNAIYSVIIAIIAIIIYISIRFKFSFALSSILALAHDVLFVMILFSVFKIPPTIFSEISSIPLTNIYVASKNSLGYSIPFANKTEIMC